MLELGVTLVSIEFSFAAGPEGCVPHIRPGKAFKWAAQRNGQRSLPSFLRTIAVDGGEGGSLERASLLAGMLVSRRTAKD